MDEKDIIFRIHATDPEIYVLYRILTRISPIQDISKKQVRYATYVLPRSAQAMTKGFTTYDGEHHDGTTMG
jgi:hypothetical protein